MKCQFLTGWRVVVVQLLSHVLLFATPWTAKHARLPCPSLSPWVCSDWCILSQWCYPTISSSVAAFSSCSQSFPASGSFPVSRLNVLELQHQTFSEYSGLISFRLDLLAVQGALKSLLQHHSSKASVLRCSAFFIVQLSHPYKNSMSQPV